MNDICSRCGKGGPRLGGFYTEDAFCRCPEKKPVKKPRATRQRSTFESASLSVAEQLVLLVQLRQQGALSEDEFATLKSRLVDGEG
jgi:hypothetical protein